MFGTYLSIAILVLVLVSFIVFIVRLERRAVRENERNQPLPIHEVRDDYAMRSQDAENLQRVYKEHGPEIAMMYAQKLVALRNLNYDSDIVNTEIVDPPQKNAGA